MCVFVFVCVCARVAHTEVGHVTGPWDGKIVVQGLNPTLIPKFETNVFDSSQHLVGRVQVTCILDRQVGRYAGR